MLTWPKVKVYVIADGWAITVTERQVGILQMLSEGHEGVAIREEFRMSETTFKRQLMQICQKLGASNRTHAVALALRAELIR